MATYYYPEYIFLQEFAQYGLVALTGDTAPYTLVYIQGTSQANQDLVQAAANAWDWTPVTPVPADVPAPPNSNPLAFLAAIWIDQTLSATAKVMVANLENLLVRNINNPGVITQYWTYLVASAPAWLDSQTQTTILSYASTYGVPLV